MSLLDELYENRERIIELATKYGGSNIRVFGSVARGEEREGSDIDLLVTIDRNRSLLDMAKLQLDLEKFLHKRVDLVSENGIYPKFREYIMSDAKDL